MPLDEELEGMLREENPQAEAVRSLIKVADKKKGSLGSEIELKTDLTSNEVVIHTAVDMMNRILDMSPKDFNSGIITQDLVQIKERKLLSKNRLSRREIVEVSKTPEMNMGMDMGQQSFVKKLFTPKQKPMY